MSGSMFLEGEFFLLVVSSMLLPSVIYGLLFFRPSISRVTVFILAEALILLSGVDIYLLQSLSAQVKATPSLVDDRVFASELSIALYLLPAVFAGVAVNLISHLLIDHLKYAEQRFERERERERRQAGKSGRH